MQVCKGSATTQDWVAANHGLQPFCLGQVPAYINWRAGVEIFFYLLENFRKVDEVHTSHFIFLYQLPSADQWANLSYSLYFAEAYNEFTGPIFASLYAGDTAPLEEMLQLRQAVGNTVRVLFQPQSSRSRDERVTARTTGLFWSIGHALICSKESE